MTEPSQEPRPCAPAVGRIVAVCLSRVRGIPKTPVEKIDLRESWGVEGDAHAGAWHRQLSLLANESADLIRKKGLDICAGAFGENLVTEGIELHTLEVGTRLRVGSALIELTQLGKQCHDRCGIYERVGMCVMPSRGVFGRVIRSGTIRPGDSIQIISDASLSTSDCEAP